MTKKNKKLEIWGRAKLEAARWTKVHQIFNPNVVGVVVFKLEIWGRAKLEAARCPKSDRKYNLGVVGHVKI